MEAVNSGYHLDDAVFIDSCLSMMQSAWVCMSDPILIKPSSGSTKVSMSAKAMRSA